AAAPLIGLGTAAMADGDAVRAGRVTACLESLSDTGAWARAAVDELVQPALAPFLALCTSVWDDLHARTKFERSAEAAAQNIEPCAAGLERFRVEVKPSLDKLLLFIPAGHDGRARAC